MTSSACQPAVAATPDDWITVDKAAELTGHSVRHWRRLAARAFQRQLACQAPPVGGKGKPVWWLHRSLDSRLTRHPTKAMREDRARLSLIERYPADHVDLAYRKAHWLRQWRMRVERPRPAGLTDLQLAGRVVADARRSEPDDFKISVRSLQAWHTAYNALGDDGHIRGVEALVPKYAHEPGAAAVTRSPDAVAFFYSLFHAQKPFTIRACHEATLREAKARAWSWPPSVTATTRWLRKYDRLDLTCLHREGAGPYSHKFMPHLETDWDAIQPGEMYVCDHTQCDFWVSYRDQQIRPWLTAIQDMRSRVIVGRHLGPAPHSDAIAHAFMRAFRDWAIPQHMRIDNGKDFCSKWLTGLTKSEVRALRREYGGRWKEIMRTRRDHALGSDPRWLGLTPELGIDLIYAIPYAAWSKGTVERWFGTFHDQCGKTFVTYCGNSPQTKPECIEEIRKGRRGTPGRGVQLVDTSDIPTLDQAAERIGQYLDVYHRTAHRGAGMTGRTPLELWATAQSLRKADPTALAFLVSIRGAYKVTGNGVSLTVSGARLSFGARSHALRRFAGREVLVGVDPAHPVEAFAFEPDTRRLIARLEPNKRIHPCATTDDVREAIAETQRDRKVMRQGQRTAARRTRSASERINAHVTAKRAELLATGTDNAQANIVPVRTGFERLPAPVRTDSADAFCPSDDEDLSDLFDDSEPDLVIDDDDAGFDELLDDPETDPADPDDDLEELL